MRSRFSRFLNLSEGHVRSAKAFAANAAPPSIGHDPPLSNLDELVYLLHTAAEVEHALMVQYLYAAYSLKAPKSGLTADQDKLVDTWRDTLVSVAREEMGHLISVQNVLRAVGGPLNFEREDFPFRTGLYPFFFRLEPLSLDSVAKYLFAEMPAMLADDSVLDQTSGLTVKEVRAQANQSNEKEPVNHVGPLYTRIIELVRALPTEAFHADRVRFQASRQDWVGEDPRLQGMIVEEIATREKAAEVLGLIAEQGEGEGAAKPDGPPSHFQRFLGMYLQLLQNKDWSPVRPMAVNPNTEPQPAPPPVGAKAAFAAVENERQRQLEPGRITHYETRLWAQLFNVRYRILLNSLSHFLSIEGDVIGGAAPSARGLLKQRALEEMIRLSPLAVMLTMMPRTQASDAAADAAGPPFEIDYTLALPDLDVDRWMMHRAVADGAGKLVAALRETSTGTRFKAVLDAIDAGDAGFRKLVEQLNRPPAPLPGRRAPQIAELCLLPSLAIARFGSSPLPMDNYDLTWDDKAGPRRLRPAATLDVDSSGAVSGRVVPDAVRFRDGDGLIRPVCPFLELWVRFDDGGPLEPLTLKHLEKVRVTAADIRWRVRAANLKMFRRTRDANDRVTADTGWFTNHDPHALAGTCTNFRTDKFVPFGSARYIRPTSAFPEIRLRFTPATGKVYGPIAPDDDPNVVDDVYNGDRGTWDNYADVDEARITQPGGIYAPVARGAGQSSVSRGYLDDSCDAVIQIQLWAGGRLHEAFARVAVGPPMFAPDRRPIRTVSDELEQAAFGPVPHESPATAAADIFRSAIDTICQMNTEVANGNFADASSMARHDRGAPIERAWQAIIRDADIDPSALITRHQGILDALAAGRPIDLSYYLRQFDEVGDLTDAGRRRMPAFMRGADGMYLALTRRQRASLLAAGSATVADNPPAASAKAGERSGRCPFSAKEAQ